MGVNHIKNSIDRSAIMRTVKSSGNKSTELKLIAYFRKHKITGWRRNYTLPGKPDFVFVKHRIVIFTDGCFWHGHDCRLLTPKSNQEYWLKKISRNKTRDKAITKLLRSKGWTVIRIWECNITNKKAGALVYRLKALVFNDFTRT